MPDQVNFFTLLFADDTTLQDHDDDLGRQTIRCNLNLKKAAEWFQANRLTLYIYLFLSATDTSFHFSNAGAVG